MCRPKLHVTPKENWLNDPNGFIWYKGKYHLFYQHYPNDVRWGPMHWGHKTSTDLVHWEDKGVALFPDSEFDRDGCFSGAALEVNGKLYIYYTAILYDELNEEDPLITGHELLASQALIISDGETFNPKEKRVIIPQFRVEDNYLEGDRLFGEGSLPIHGNSGNVRDPKVWKQGDTYYMILGSQHPVDGKMRGELLFYTSEDAEHWKFSNVYRNPELDTEMFECPDVFKLGDEWVFVTSPFGVVSDEKNYKDNAKCCLAQFNENGCDFSMSSELHLIDYGMDYYAPQTTTDECGSRTIIGWLRMPEPFVDEATGESWIGAFSFPRLVEIRDNHICFPIHPNVKKSISSKNYDLFEGNEVFVSGVRIWRENDKIWLDRSRVFGNYEKIGNIFSTPEVPCNRDGAINVEIYEDIPIIEIYVNDGWYVMSCVIYPDKMK